MIQELRKRQAYVDRAIAELEKLERIRSLRPTYPEPQAKSRGRKFMTDQERRVVSERMKKYWSTRNAPDGNNNKPKARLPSV
jgi:hypothetical protein